MIKSMADESLRVTSDSTCWSPLGAGGVSMASESESPTDALARLCKAQLGSFQTGSQLLCVHD